MIIAFLGFTSLLFAILMIYFIGKCCDLRNENKLSKEELNKLLIQVWGYELDDLGNLIKKK
jgi:hypothetical protein